jgi:hypothetical protein
MMTMLPALLLTGKQGVETSHEHGQLRMRIERIWLGRPVWVIAITASLCLAALWAGRKVYFDYNLIKMQSPSLPSVVYEQTLLDSADKSLLYGVVLADSLTNAVAAQEKLAQLPTVAETQPPFYKDFLNPNPGEKMRLIGEIKAEVAPLKFSAPDRRPVDLPELSSSLFYTACYLNLAAQETGTNDPALTRQLAALGQSITDLRKAMLRGDANRQAEHAAKLASFQQALLADLRDTFQLLQQQDNLTPARPEDLPPALYHRFIGQKGKFLIQVYPKEDVWQRGPQERFVRDMRTVDVNATGTPVQLLEYETLLKNSYVQAAWYALAAIAFMVLIHFRSLTALVLVLRTS